MPRASFALAPVVLLLTGAALAQPPAPAAAPRPAPAPLQVPNPHYISIPLSIEVNAPVDKVWARIGKYCDIGEWGIPNCTILSGDGGFGTVRSIGNEILVGKFLAQLHGVKPTVATKFGFDVDPVTRFNDVCSRLRVRCPRQSPADGPHC